TIMKKIGNILKKIMKFLKNQPNSMYSVILFMYIIVLICKKRSKFQKILKNPIRCCIGIGQFEINNQSLVSTAHYYWGKHIYSRDETIGEYIVENGIPNYRWIKCDKKVIGRETRCV